MEPNAEETKKKRRSSYGGALKLAAMDEMENDDEAERQELKRKKEEQRQKALLASPYKEGPSSKTEGSYKAEEELFRKLSSTISLCTENKINSANSFNTDLIENLHVAVGMDETETNFQQASCALDAGVKIYEKRVDNVHQSTLKMLGGINRADVDTQNEDDDDADIEETSVAQKPRRKKATSSQPTIETNVDNINLPVEERSKVFDPLFHMMAGMFDEGGARGMLLHNLNVSTSGGIVFDSCPPADTDGADDLSEQCSESFVSQSLLGKLQAISVAPKRQLCPEFDAYCKSVESEISQEMPGPVDQCDDVDPESEPEDDTYEERDDMDMPDDMFPEDGPEDHSPLREQMGESQDVAARPTWNQMVCALDEINFSDEYSFFTKKLQSSWAGGPGKWKPENRAASNEPKKKLSKKVALTIDFDTVHEMDFGSSFDLPARMGTDRLSDNAIEKALESASSLLLPSDHQYKAAQLLSLFLRPKKKVRRFKGAAQGVPGEQTGESYNYSNAADVTNYVAPQDFDDEDHGGFDDDDCGGFDEHNDGGNDMGSEGLGFDMVAEPTKVAKVDIAFDRVAKKLDVKALKESMWKRIQAPEVAEGEPIEEENHTNLFTDVLKDIPEIIPQDMVSTVSVPFCFICLLHLANEKTLELNDSEDLSQLTITCS